LATLRRVDLEDVSFRDRAGQVAAFVGPTGGGKTTIINLIARFYDPVSGTSHDRRQRHPALSRFDRFAIRSVCLAGHAALPRPDLAKHRYGRPRQTAAEIVRAAEQANAHEFIKDMPDGYDTMVGERG
jgi:ABC-type transport system involved in Fe-S cluster assembly fused permease/ATPase subunit